MYTIRDIRAKVEYIGFVSLPSNYTVASYLGSLVTPERLCKATGETGGQKRRLLKASVRLTKIIDGGLRSLQICHVNQSTFSFRNGLFSKNEVRMNMK